MLVRATPITNDTTPRDTPAGARSASDPRVGLPSYPRVLWQAWQAYAKRAGSYQSGILLSGVYLLILGPSALVARLGGVRLLDLDSAERPSYWSERKPGNQTLAELEREF